MAQLKGMNLSDTIFDEFEQEIAKSEYQRALMLVGVFFAAMVVMSFLNFFLLDSTVIKFYGGSSIFFLR